MTRIALKSTTLSACSVPRVVLAVLVAEALLFGVMVAQAGPTPEQRCQAEKNQASGKYAACRHNAAAKLITNSNADAYAQRILRCKYNFASTWEQSEAKAMAAGATCLDASLAEGDFETILAESTTNIATALAGGGLTDCTANLATCAGDLGTCTSNLGICATDLTQATSDLTSCNGTVTTLSGNLSTCTGSLRSCNNSLSVCNESLGTCTTDLAMCQAPAHDLVFANFDAPNRICLDDGSGSFTCSNVDNITYRSTAVAIADLDGDGDSDLVFANSNNTNTRCLNNGSGLFSCALVDTPGYSTDVATGDFNKDGVVDLVFARWTGTAQSRVCLGTGLGNFTCGDVGSATVESHAVAVGDFNNDMNQDVVFGRGGLRNRLCLGDGAGAFSCGDVSADAPQDSLGVAVGDLNGDGKLDLVFANTERIPPAGFHNRVCLGDGAGGFTCSDVSSTSLRAVGVALGDVNGDNLLDAVFADFNQQRNRVCIGNGAGGFTCNDVGTDAFASSDVILADFNHDGAPDAVFANGAVAFGEKSRLCLNDGIGGFTCQDVSSDVRDTTDVATGAL